MERLLRYFTEGVESCAVAESVGIEVETSFVYESGTPISVEDSQRMLRWLCAERRWKIRKVRNQLVTEISDYMGNVLLYELGQQNIELAAAPSTAERAVVETLKVLNSLYDAAKTVGAKPYHAPVLQTDENLLVIPDERDAVWLQLDGRPALELLARISAVQFTISVSPENAVACLNKLGRYINTFLADYPQDEHWRRYIRESRAGYHPLRYGGPLFFRNLEDYCFQLSQHDVVVGPRLVPFESVAEMDIPLFLRSIWWYFRLKRYGKRLCIEVRPLARRDDGRIEEQLKTVLDTSVDFLWPESFHGM
jgi:hypothetical protein